MQIVILNGIWNLDSGPFKIRTNGCHFVKNHLNSRQKCLGFEWLGLCYLLKPDHLNSHLQRVRISNVSRFQMFGFQNPTVIVIIDTVQGQSYKANFGINYIRNGLNKLKFSFELHQFWCNLCQKSFIGLTSGHSKSVFWFSPDRFMIFIFSGKEFGTTPTWFFHLCSASMIEQPT